MAIKGVLFDLFDTLFIPPSREEIKTIQQEFSVVFTCENQEKWFFASFPLALLFNNCNVDVAKARDFLLTSRFGSKVALSKALKEKYGIKFLKKDIELVQNLYGAYISKCKPVPQLFEAIDHLKAKGIRTALLTNMTEQWFPLVNKYNLKKRFDACIFSCDYGIKKPDPRVFKTALSILKLNPSESVMIGDNLISDIIGAKNVGIETIMVQFKKNTYSLPFNPGDYIDTTVCRTVSCVLRKLDKMIISGLPKNPSFLNVKSV